MTVRHFAAAALLAAMSLGAYAQQTIDFGYATSDEYVNWGTQKAEAYDVAILVKEQALVGSKITAIQIPVCGDADIINTSVWMSKTLSLSGKVNVPDLWQADVTFPEGLGTIEYTLAEPYTITEDGVYVGYSFTVNKINDDLDAFPVVVTEGGTMNGFWIHTKRTYTRWQNKSSALDITVPIFVKVEGEFHANCAALTSCSAAIAGKDAGAVVDVNIINNGTNAIETVGYTLTVDGVAQSGEYTFETPVTDIFGTKATFQVQFPQMDKGEYEYTLVLDKVNGADNADANNVLAGDYIVYTAKPVNRPLMEEFTGTWCGWCVRGWMAMELMHDAHPDTFIGIAYHNGDPMNLSGANSFINAYADGFPECAMNRTTVCDPYGGSNNANFGINTLFNKMAAQFNPCSVDVRAAWTNDDHTAIDMLADVTFVSVPEGSDYRVEFVLVGNNITGTGTDSWLQSNYYLGQSGSPADMEPFVSGQYASNPVAIPFNDVALLTTGYKGIVGSLEGIEQDVTMQVENTFNLSDVKNSSGQAIPYDADNLQVVAIVLDLTDGSYGKVVNSARADIANSLGVNNVSIDTVKAIDSIEYYDLSGRKVANPANGIFIKSIKYIDGSRLNTKIAR